MGEAMKAMEELNKAEREKFLKSLPASLSAAQSEKLMASLGTFNRQWDTAADMIAEFKLEPAKQQAALNAMEDFVVSSAKARGPAGAGPGDAEDARVAILEAREKLLDELKKTLNDEQFSKVETTLSQRGMRQGGRGGRPGGPDAPPPPPGRG
ncbi:MAG: hypothetical protein JNM07_08935 [Phycisphaerae bacterium]|nr:hypothetical protein [Phycisphaerae bacterium]